MQIDKLNRAIVGEGESSNRDLRESITISNYQTTILAFTFVVFAHSKAILSHNEFLQLNHASELKSNQIHKTLITNHKGLNFFKDLEIQ